MIIYFVNKYTKISSPFEITDDTRSQIIKIGDICIRDIGGLLSFLVVKKKCNDWSSCICVCKSYYDRFDIKANSLLFSFDNLKGRRGNAKLLTVIANVFSNTLVSEFIKTAIDILEYKKDKWDIDLLLPIYSNIEAIGKDNYSDKTEKKEENVLFYSYLSENLKSRFNDLQKEQYSLKQIYQIIKKENEDEFHKAIFRFLHDNPDSTIYNRT